jgi:hypothetical protein
VSYAGPIYLIQTHKRNGELLEGDLFTMLGFRWRILELLPAAAGEQRALAERVERA